MRCDFSPTELADWKPGVPCKPGEGVLGQASVPSMLIRAELGASLLANSPKYQRRHNRCI